MSGWESSSKNYCSSSLPSAWQCKLKEGGELLAGSLLYPLYAGGHAANMCSIVAWLYFPLGENNTQKSYGNMKTLFSSDFLILFHTNNICVYIHTCYISSLNSVRGMWKKREKEETQGKARARKQDEQTGHKPYSCYSPSGLSPCHEMNPQSKVSDISLA